MNRRTIIFLIAAILILGTTTVLAMEPSVETSSKTTNSNTDEEVTVTNLNVNTNDAEVKKAETAEAKESVNNINQEEKKVKAEEAKEVVNRKKKRSSDDDEDSFDFWFNRPRSRFNKIFKNLFDDDEDDGDLFGNVFKDFFGDVNPFGKRRRGAQGLLGRNKRPIASLLSGLFNDDEEDTAASNELVGGWDTEDWPIVREPRNLLSSFSKMFQDLKRKEKDEWKETAEAYELRVKLPEGMKKENVQIEIEKAEDEAGRHSLLIHGKAEKHEEVNKDAPTDNQAPQIQDSNKPALEGQAADETKKTDVVATPENKEVSATPTKFYKKMDQVSELERRHVIPATVDTDKVSAEIQDNNTLVITLAKKAEAIKRPQKVSVNIH